MHVTGTAPQLASWAFILGALSMPACCFIIAFRPQLQIGLKPEAFVAADLRLSMWNLDDGLRPIRGVPAALLVRDNGLDTSAAAMLDAVRAFRPNLVQA